VLLVTKDVGGAIGTTGVGGAGAAKA